MNLACTIDVALACAGWTRLCPRAESLARGAAELALERGTTVLGLAWQGTVELGITLADDANQRQLNRDYRGLDHLLAHKPALEAHLSERCGELFAVQNEVLLYERGFWCKCATRVCAGHGMRFVAFRPRALCSRLRIQLCHEYRDVAAQIALCGCNASAQCRRSWSQHCRTA